MEGCFWPVLMRSGSTGGEGLSRLGLVEPCSGAQCLGDGKRQQEISCFRQKLHGRESRLPCSSHAGVLWGGSLLVDLGPRYYRTVYWQGGSAQATNATVNLSRPLTGRDGQRIDVAVASTPSPGLCRGPWLRGSHGDIRRKTVLLPGRSRTYISESRHYTTSGMLCCEEVPERYGV